MINRADYGDPMASPLTPPWHQQLGFWVDNFFLKFGGQTRSRQDEKCNLPSLAVLRLDL